MSIGWKEVKGENKFGRHIARYKSERLMNTRVMDISIIKTKNFQFVAE